MGSFSPWTMRVGQLIWGRSSMQMLPDQRTLSILALPFSPDIYQNRTNLRFRTFWSFCKLCDAIHPGLPGFSKDFCSVHLLHGLPHPRTPLGDVTDRCVFPQKPKDTQRSVTPCNSLHSSGLHRQRRRTMKSRAGVPS